MCRLPRRSLPCRLARGGLEILQVERGLLSSAARLSMLLARVSQRPEPIRLDFVGIRRRRRRDEHRTDVAEILKASTLALSCERVPVVSPVGNGRDESLEISGLTK